MDDREPEGTGSAPDGRSLDEITTRLEEMQQELDARIPVDPDAQDHPHEET